MKWTSILGLLLAFGSLGFVARAVFSPNDINPTQVLTRLEAALEGEILEPEPLLRLSEHALRHPSMKDSPLLQARLLVAQADLYTSLESWHEARLCLERVSMAMDITSPAVQLRLAKIFNKENKPAEAWQLCVEILANSPQHGPAWALRGAIESEQAESMLAGAQKHLSMAIAGRQGDKAALMAEEIAMRSLDDQARLRLVNELRSMFEMAREGALGVEALAGLSEASSLFDSARRSYSEAVSVLALAKDKSELESGYEALGNLLTLLWGARQDLTTAELGLIAAPLVQGKSSDTAVLATLNALEAMGQQERAIALLKTIDLQSPNLSLSLVQRATQLAWQARDHRLVNQLASVLRQRGTPIQREHGSWYTAMSHLDRDPESQVDRIEYIHRGLGAMSVYLEGKRVPPMTDGTALLLLAAASGYRELEQTADEMSLLTEAVQLAPRVDGEAWLRLAELQANAPGAGYRSSEESMTRGMALLPERALQLVPAWEDQGNASLQSENRSLLTMRRALGRTGSGLREYGPAARYQLARSYFIEEDYPTSQSLARRLRLDYPGLLPALDLELEGFLARGAMAQAGLLLMKRIDLTGPDDKFREFLARVGAGNLTASQYRRLTQKDPKGEGRLAIAEQFLVQGEPKRALAALGDGADPEGDTAQHHLLRAETLIQLGRSREAVQPASLAAADPQTSGAGWLLLIQSQLSGSPKRLATTVGRFIELTKDPQLNVPRLEIVDTLLGAARPLEALRIARAMDEHSELRGGPLLQRLALCDALLGNDQDLAESLDRWEAFREDGKVEWTRLVLAMDRGEWSQLPGLARAVRTTEGYQASPWQNVFLAVCEEQPDEALRLAQEGQEEHPLDPSWSLTLGLVQDLENHPIQLPEYLGESAVHELFAVLHPTDRARVDPRHMLGLLGAAQIEGWGLWALPRISNLSPKPTLWALMLAERAQQSLGQEDRAERVRIAVTNGHPTFSPAWVRREREAAKKAGGDRWALEVHALRVERRKAAGRQDLQNEARNTLDSGLLAWELGQPDRAQTLLKKFLAKHPDEHELRWVMGRIHASQGRNLQAVGEMYRVWRSLYPILPTADDGPTAPAGKLPFHQPGSPRTRELLSMIQTTVAAPRSKLSLRDAASLLHDMEEAIPHDPLILLARTRAESQLDDHSTALAAARATGALELLQERLSLIGLDPRGELSIEDVATGSAEVWGAWLLDISPDLAHDFLERELLRAPGRSDLWHLNAQALIALGRIDAARNQLQALSRASHSPRGLLLLAALEARTGAEPEVVSTLLAQARSTLNPSQTALADFSETWANLQHGDPVGRNLQVLGRLWKERASSTLDLDENTLRLVYYATMVRRNRPQDHTRLQQLSDSILRRGQGSSYLSPTIRAMTGLSAALQAQLELE